MFLILSLGLFSQEENESLKTPNRMNTVGLTLGVGGMGMSLFSGSIDVFVVKNINIELGLGSGFGLTSNGVFYSSVTHHQSFSKDNPSLNFFYGLGYAKYETILQWTNYGRWENTDAFYLALGFQFISGGGFTLKLEFGPGYQLSTETQGYDNSTMNTNRMASYAGLKFGFHFGGNLDAKKQESIEFFEKDFIKKQRKSKGNFQNDELKKSRRK